MYNPLTWVDPLGLAGEDCLKKRILENIANSKKARESSNFKQFNEWPPNRGFSGVPQPTTLQPVTIIDRYGHEYGTFVSPANTPYRARSPKPGTDGKPLTLYEVKKPIEAMSGKAAPWFGYEGGGIQHELSKRVIDLINDGSLVRL